MNNKEYWDSFYNNFDINEPTTFAKFCMKYIGQGENIIDIGCGNGRDSYFFAKNKIKVTGIDMSIEPKNKKNVIFLKNDFKHYKHFSEKVYGRFFLHSISEQDIHVLFRMAKGMVMLEFRDKDDIPIIYHHPRTHIEGNKILMFLVNNNFNILFYEKSRGLAVFKNEDPLICRIIAERK